MIMATSEKFETELTERDKLKKAFCDAYSLWAFHTTHQMSRARDVELSWVFYCTARDRWLNFRDPSNFLR